MKTNKLSISKKTISKFSTSTNLVNARTGAMTMLGRTGAMTMVGRTGAISM